MMDKYYNPTECQELADNLVAFEDVLKYLLTLAPEAEDKKLLTPQLEKAFYSVIANCAEITSAYSHYKKI